MHPQLGLPRVELPFDELAELRDLTQQLLGSSLASLENYRDPGSGGFFHVLETDIHGDPQAGDGAKDNDPGDFSKASTATVVKYLAASGQWVEDADTASKAQTLFDRVVVDQEWTSAELTGDNPFTVAFLLELAGDLADLGAACTDAQAATIAAKLSGLRSALADGVGSIAYEPRLPNAFLTQLAVRTLKSWDGRTEIGSTHTPRPGPDEAPLFDDDLRDKTRKWALATVDTEIALASSAPREADVFELGYAILLVYGSTPPHPSPIERRRLAKGFELVFEAQSSDGTWPQSRRLFHYPKYGNAYCYEYEFLTQVLDGIDDSLLLRPFLPHLRRAIDRLTHEYVHLPRGGYGWMSGHHRQLSWPESWSTASCFHFAHLLDRFVAGATRDGILDYLDARPSHPNIQPEDEPLDRLLDSAVRHGGEEHSLKAVLVEKLVAPVVEQRETLRNGGQLRGGTALSAILYGPPGTSKTTYVSALAAKIGWSLIGIDPSHLLRNGFANLLPEMNRVFGMLEYAENVVVFFDEFDELVRDRFGEDEESTSRILTTAMLPKIIKLRESRRLLFFVATNHLEVFDAAISRPGRFDLILPVMPPTTAEKLAKWELQVYFDEKDISLVGDLGAKAEALTYAEFEALVPRLLEVENQTDFEEALNAAHARSTLESRADKDNTWAELMKKQQEKVRMP